MKTELELKKEGFRRIKSRFSSVCHFCGQRIPAGTEIYWKRRLVAPKSYRTITVCQDCWLDKIAVKQAPQCDEPTDEKEIPSEQPTLKFFQAGEPNRQERKQVHGG